MSSTAQVGDLGLDPETRRAATELLAGVGDMTLAARSCTAAAPDRRIVRTVMPISLCCYVAVRVELLETALGMADIAFDVLLETNVLIWPLPIWEEEWEHPDDYLNPGLLRHITRDGVRI